MMWGTDCPGILNNKGFYAKTLTYLREGNLFSSEELDLIYGETAKVLYGF